MRTRSPPSAGSLSDASKRRAGPLGGDASSRARSDLRAIRLERSPRGDCRTVTLCLRCVIGVIETSSACSRPPGVAGADGRSATRRCLAVFPKNSRNTRAAEKSHESERVATSRSAPSFAAASFRALRMRAAFPCDTLLPRLFEGRSGSTTFMYLTGMRTRGAVSATLGGGSSSGDAPPPARFAPAALSSLAACCRMIESLPYLSSMRHINSRVRSSSSSPSPAPFRPIAPSPPPPAAEAPDGSTLAVPATRSAMRTGP